jgi:hypothetical protein
MYEQIYTWMTGQLAGNDVFVGLVGASAIGTALFLARSVPAALWNLAVRHLTTELTVRSTDPAFEWIRLWLSRHPYGQRSRRLRLSSRGKDDDGSKEWTLVPGEGFHLFLHRGRPIAMCYSVDEKQSRGHLLKETFHLRAPGRSQAFLRELVADAVRIGSLDDRVAIYGWFGYWQLAARKRPRPLETVILPDGLMELVVEDAAWFFGAEDWYVARGVPYRRGYLLSGPPGTGKSSLALALAGHFGRPIYTLNLSAMGNDSVLAETFADVPRDAFLLLEDIDACKAALSREHHDGKEQRTGGLTLAGLLNAIDGVAASDGRLLIMTSNHPERLDPALVRPGRIDLKIPFRLLEAEDVRRMYLRFHPGEEAKAARYTALTRTPVSPAELQRRLMGADPMAGICIEATPVAAE